MKRPVLLLVTALLFAVALPAQAQPGDVNLGAFAQFRTSYSTVRPGDPCVETVVNIDAEEVVREGEKTHNQVIVDVVEFDTCIVDDFGLVAEWYTVANLPDPALQFNADATMATLRRSLKVCNLVHPFECRNLRLDITWTTDGSGTQAVGTVYDRTFHVNLTPDPAVFASLNS